MVAYAISFLLGGVSALLVMCFLLFFMEHSKKKSKDNIVLKQIADTLRDFYGFKGLQEISQPTGAERLNALKILPENSSVKDYCLADRKLDMEYNPVPGLL